MSRIKKTAEAYKAALNCKKAKAEADALAGKLPSGRTGGAAHTSLSPCDRLVLEPERKALTGYCRGHWWRLEQDGLVPRRIRIGPRKVAWLLSELQSWMCQRAALRDAGGADARSSA